MYFIYFFKAGGLLNALSYLLTNFSVYIMNPLFVGKSELKDQLFALSHKTNTVWIESRWPIQKISKYLLSFYVCLSKALGLPHRSVGKESACKAGDPGSIPGLGRPTGEGIGYPLQYSWVFLVAQLVKNSSPMRETWVQSLDWEDPLEKVKAKHSRFLAWRIPWTVQSVESQRVRHN